MNFCSIANATQSRHNARNVDTNTPPDSTLTSALTAPPVPLPTANHTLRTTMPRRNACASLRLNPCLTTQEGKPHH